MDFYEIAELMKAKYRAVKHLTGITVSFLKASQETATNAMMISSKFAEKTLQDFRDDLVELAMDQWAMSMDQVVAHKVRVIVDFDPSGIAPAARRALAPFRIIYEECQSSGSSGPIYSPVTGHYYELNSISHGRRKRPVLRRE